MTATITATITVQKGSAYSHLNGQSYPVVEIVGTRVTVLIDHQKVDFYNTPRWTEAKIGGV